MGRAGALEGAVLNPNEGIVMANAPVINGVEQNNRGAQILRRDVFPQQELSKPTPKPAPQPPVTERTDNAQEGSAPQPASSEYNRNTASWGVRKGRAKRRKR